MKELHELDDLDLRILQELQQDSSLSQQQLAERVHSSAPTCLRRVARLKKTGWIEREVAIVSANKVLKTQGLLHAIVEVTLEQQNAQWLDEFERAACAAQAVQQCWRTTAGPDFVLIIQVQDMEAYQALAAALFTQNHRVRNVKTFFASKRAKFTTQISLREGHPH